MPGSLSVFLSYSHADKPVAQAIATGLTRRGVQVWIDEGELRIGDSIIERISEAIEEVHFVVALVSATAVQSHWCRKELSLAMTGGLRRKGVKILPVRLGDVQMPPALMDSYYVQIDPRDPDVMLDKLVRDASRHQSEFDSAAASSARVMPHTPKSQQQPHTLNPYTTPDDGMSPEISRMCEESIKDATRSGFPPTSLDRKNGIVKWFNSEKGFGFVKDDLGNDYFVHYSFIVTKGFRELTEGQIVTFIVGQGSKGPAAVAVVPR